MGGRATSTAGSRRMTARPKYPDVAGREIDSPGGRTTVEQHIDQVVSADMALHGWDLARATGPDETMDPADVEQMWARPCSAATAIES